MPTKRMIIDSFIVMAKATVKPQLEMRVAKPTNKPQQCKTTNGNYPSLYGEWH
jgi:hypothetical protein